MFIIPKLKLKNQVKLSQENPEVNRKLCEQSCETYELYKEIL